MSFSSSRSVACSLVAFSLTGALAPTVARAVVSAADTPTELRTAYGLTGTTRTNYTGEGVTIAVYASSSAPYYGLQADMTYFSNAYGIADATLSYYYADNLTNGKVSGYQRTIATTDTTTSSELAMDVEYAHYMAPKAKIVVVSGDSWGGAAQYAATVLGASVFTTSFASYESSVGASSATASSVRFGYADAAGMTSFAAVGDSGPYDFPASSPYVVGVGATNLYVNTATNGTITRSSESSWSTTGGGTSEVFATPNWQKAVNPGAFRQGPDVSIVGSGLNTMPVRVGAAYKQYAGTSLSSPLWAGIMALVQEARLDKGLDTLSTTDTMTALYGLVGTANYAKAFNDITSSPSGSVNVAGVGFDTATGLGTPNVPFLVSYLASVPEPTSLAIIGLAAGLLGRRARRA